VGEIKVTGNENIKIVFLAYIRQKWIYYVKRNQND